MTEAVADPPPALRVESRYFTKVLRSKEAAAMIRSLFLSMQELNKGARRPANVPPTKVKKIAVIGAGKLTENSIVWLRPVQ